MKKEVVNLWEHINQQNWTHLTAYFVEDAIINWHDTNEQFNVAEFVQANACYPGDWQIQIERLEQIGKLVISVTKVSLSDGKQSFHATSFFHFEHNKIAQLDEYWSEITQAPQWRQDKRIGRRIE
ncbi:nuclear transport factor 2 family protein [Isobaculum melis]|uniref:SnoaL-like domain-containing protein n=1 Tax=Isobaculum melis TaxID=142588 RepID=A0A1H9RU08_9LACT|nr:nuclear transport factor 2 family protein [Isobaculum melis]SER76196.1 hypothetical protein SAMN04488559_10578 [Isobaculum melis]